MRRGGKFYIISTTHLLSLKKPPSTSSRAAPPLVHRTDQHASWGKWGQECVLIFQAPNYKGECALSSRPPDAEEDRPNQALSL